MPERRRWSPSGARGPEEIARILEFRTERALADYARAVREARPALCPICGYEGRFAPKRHKAGIWCPQCDSRARHRLMRLWLDRCAPGALTRSGVPDAVRHDDAAPQVRDLPGRFEVIHFAAEPWARGWFEARGARYRTADINGLFDLRLDIGAMDLPEASVDLLIANHVLEHVDDRAALAEIARVLRPGGRALLTVPIIEGWDETLEVGDLPEAERTRLAGDPDHRRFYGRDLRGRIRGAGLALSEFAATEPDVSAHALARGERLFIATKPSDRGA